MIKKITLIATFFVAFPLFAQQEENRAITTAVPFLNISADARAAGMGDMGVATGADGFSMQWNPSKYAFAENSMGFTASYTPYLENIVTDVALLNANFYNKVSERSAFAFGLRYFGLGEVELRQTIEEEGTTVKPNEFVLEGAYALKLSQTFSMGVSGRFISSSLKFPIDDGSDSQAATGFAVDVSGFYRSQEKAYNSFDGRWRAGFNFSNIGGKMSYDAGGQKNFLPSNMRLGLGFDFILDQDNVLALTTEFNKLLVPTPQDFNEDGVIDSQDNERYQEISFLEGFFDSFSDAPDGFGEELKETTWALGAEYSYQDSFMLRGGYFNENEQKGARKFFSLGAGFKFKATQIDLSYLFSTSAVKNPLENTLRFSLTFNLGEQLVND